MLGWAPSPPPAVSLAEWLLIKPITRARLQQLSVGIYVVHRLVNHLRHTGPKSREYRTRFANQCFVEAQRGDKKLQAALRRTRQEFFTGRRRRAEPPMDGRLTRRRLN